MIINKNIKRRKFVKGLSATAALSTFGGLNMNFAGADKQYRVGLIGSGWYGKSDLFRLIQVSPVDVVAVCDPDQQMLEAAGKLISERQLSKKVPTLYEDYRTMLEKHDFDIVLIGSPDHWHAMHTIAALQAGAHVYVQKPTSVDVVEGEAMLKAARKYGKVVQVGTQRRSTPHLMDAKREIVDTGLLGKVSHVELCNYSGGGGPFQLKTEPIPDFFNYELWTGPAPLLPFHGLPHRRWRAHMEYGNGMIGDMGVHMLDAARWMLNVGWPKKITSVGGIYLNKKVHGNRFDTQTALFEYDELSMVWEHRMWGLPADPDYKWSFKLYGDKGTLKGSVYQAEFVPLEGEGKRYDVLYEREKYPEDLTEEGMSLYAAAATRQHMRDFLHAIETNTKPVADIEEGHISSTACILANLSLELGGRPLAYDPVKRIITGDSEATKRLAREYRASWVHPTVDNV
ncbi:MAG: Gfo/Idh/MocA family protein [Bacteroidota bacterium]